MATALKKSVTADFNPDETFDKTSDTQDLDPTQVRKKAGLSVEEMAALMAMSEFGYNAWERGQRRPGGPAYQLLRLLDDDPTTVAKALAP